MSASQNNLEDLLKLDNNDILHAMMRLTKIMDSEKQLSGVQSEQQLKEVPSDKQLPVHEPQQQPIQQYSSRDAQPVGFNPFASHQESYHNEAEILENLKSVAHELSTLEMNQPVEVSQEIDPQDERFESDNSKYLSIEKSARTDRCGSAVNRLYELDIKKREKIAAKQFEKYQQEQQTMRQKPQISHNSKIIAEQKQRAPIFERCNAIMRQREENINKMRRELEDMRGESNASPTFQPDLSHTKRSRNERSRTPKEFADQIYAWHHKKNEHIQKEQYDTIAKQLSQMTFKPKINDNSRKIARKLSTNEPVDRRLYNHKDELEERRKEMIEKDTPSFRPILNEKSQNLMKNRAHKVSKSPVGDRSAYTPSGTPQKQAKNKKEVVNQGRSVTPTKPSKGRAMRDYSPEFTKSPKVSKSPLRNSMLADKSPKAQKSPLRKSMMADKSPKAQKSPRFNELDYKPSMDFLVKRFK